MPEHRTLPHASVHEPKHITISTVSDAGKVITPSASSSGTSELRKLYPKEIDYSIKSNNLFGWNDISDNQYTSGAPRAVSSGVRTQLTNNGLAVQSDSSRLGTLWDTSLNQFMITDLNAFYNLRINLKCTAAAAASSPYILLVELESASGPTVIAGETRFIKGGSAVNQLSINLPFYVGSVVNGNAMKIFVTPDTNINLYDVGFVFQRVYKES